MLNAQNAQPNHTVKPLTLTISAQNSAKRIPGSVFKLGVEIAQFIQVIVPKLPPPSQLKEFLDGHRQKTNKLLRHPKKKKSV